MTNKENTMSWKLLTWLGSKSTQGATLTDIQYYIWTMLENKDGNEFYHKDHQNQRKTRGHWNTQLYGGYYYHGGLLHLYCQKINGKWVLKNMPKPNEKIYKKLKGFHVHKY